jgi:hypothetical protein
VPARAVFGPDRRHRRIGPESLGNEAQAANTIAHELNHARDLIHNDEWAGAEKRLKRRATLLSHGVMEDGNGQ